MFTKLKQHKILWYLFWLAAVGGLLLFVAVLYTYSNRRGVERISRIGSWFANPAAHREWQLTVGQKCPGAPMIFPTTGFIGVGWGDGAPPVYQHTGYDIFSPDGADNVTPIVAAYDGYLTRESNWRSAVIIRHPDFDALPEVTGGRPIWTYYTHMASRDGTRSYISEQFPPGTREKFVKAGTLLGYQGTWSGDPNNTRMGLHLHISVVKSNPEGSYMNETIIDNTYNPAPFFGIEVGEDGILRCREGG